MASGLTGRPLLVTAPPGDTGRIFIVEQDGFIRQLQRGAAPTAHTLFMDISAKVSILGDEQGLLGLAFDRDFQTNGFFYVNYSRALDGDTMISRFRTVDGTPNTLGAPGTEKLLLRIDHPEGNHNGGMMAFGTDGFLYVATGDGGGAGDMHGTCGNGQSTTTLLGKMLRIDPRGVSTGSPDCGLDAGPYSVPSDNPLADGLGGDCDEIWSYGLRNPWRFSFDAANDDLYIADVGQDCWEEINWASASPTCVGGSNVNNPCVTDGDCPGSSCGPGGENYGWRQREGTHCYNDPQGCAATNAANCTPPCDDLRLKDPVLDYPHIPSCSITGGYVYRGCRMPNFDGTYFYGDYCPGTVHSIDVVGGAATNAQDWTASLGSGLGVSLTSFGTDAQNEIYITDRDGLVHKIVPPLPDMQVSGLGAQQFLLAKAPQAWTWEDLNFTSMHPISSYKVYRSNTATGTFVCVFGAAGTQWPGGGDPQDPATAMAFFYVVTAVNGSGQETASGDPPQTLSPSACP